MRKITLIALLISLNIGLAQKRELGNVTVEELKEKKHPTDSSAVAAVLFETGRTYFDYSGDDGFNIITEINTKIKIYKKEGYDYANRSVPIYIGGNTNEKVVVTKAVTYNLDSGKIEKSKLSSEGEFVEKVNKFRNRKKITMPNVKEGSIIEYRITITSPFFSNFPEWEFQRGIPVNYSEYTTLIPEYFNYNLHMKGYHAVQSAKDSKSRTIQYSYTEDVVGGMMTAAPRRITTDMTFIENIIKYSCENVPALKDEGFVNNIWNYQTALKHELASIKYPNSPFKRFTTDWETVISRIYEDNDFGAELNKKGYFEKDLDAALKTAMTKEERLAAVFGFVKSRMNWDDYYGYSCNDGVKKAYETKKGNVAEINLMLTSMLRHAGFEANPVLISTRSNGIALFPSSSAFNYVISGVEMDGRIVLLDATSKFSRPNILPVRDLNGLGRLIRNNGTSAEIGLMPTENSKDVINLMAEIKSDGEITGKVREQYFDYNALGYRNSYSQMSKESMMEKIEKRYNVELSDYDVQNDTDLSKPIVENYGFASSNLTETIADRIYFSPLLFFTLKENPFKQETREYPVDFVFPNQDKFNISLTIPEGYVVDVLPAPKMISMPDNLANFKYNISNNGKQIQVSYTFDTNQAIITPEYYNELKIFFKEIVDKQTEKIVLKKV